MGTLPEAEKYILEQLPKSVKRFSDKSCEKNKELEHFQQKWTPVLRRKMRKNKELERCAFLFKRTTL